MFSSLSSCDARGVRGSGARERDTTKRSAVTNVLILLGTLIAATVVAPLLIMRMGRPAFGILALVPGAGFVWTLMHFLRGTFADGGAVEHTVEWMPSANLSFDLRLDCLLYTSPSPRDATLSRMPSSA